MWLPFVASHGLALVLSTSSMLLLIYAFTSLLKNGICRQSEVKQLTEFVQVRVSQGEGHGPDGSESLEVASLFKENGDSQCLPHMT